MLNSRITRILSELIAAKSIVTSGYLAHSIHVTSRTIRNDIKELEAVISKYGASIKSTRGTGYELKIKDDMVFRQFLQELADKDSLQPGDIPDLPEERVRYLVKRLLYAGGYVKLEDIAEELYISKSTLQNDLRDVKKVFKEYDICLEKRPNYGFKLKGEEFKLRLCIGDYLFKNKENEIDLVNTHENILPKEEIDIIKTIIIEEITKNNITLSDIGLNNLLIHLVIAFNRMKDGNHVLLENEWEDILKQKEYKVAQQIVEVLEERLNTAIPQAEVAYVTIHLLGTKMLDLSISETEMESVLDEQIYSIVKVILERIDNELNLGIKHDQELVIAISLHLKPAINRYRYGINLPNPMLDDIKSNYPIAFQAAVIAGMVLKKVTGNVIHENEIGYLALHIGAAIENNKRSYQPKRCMIVCASGVGSARLLASKIKAKFGSMVEIVGTTEYYKISKMPLDNLDFVISTIPVHVDLAVPVIQVNTILGGIDLEKIGKAISKKTNSRFQYTREELVFLQKHMETREEILTFFADNLQKLGLVNDGFIDSVLQREALSPTSYGNFVAIPHPIVPQTDSTFWSMCTLQKPVDWGGKKVQFICLLNVAKNNKDDLQKMYDLLVDVVDEAQIVQKLVKCKTFKEFETVFFSGVYEVYN